MSCDPTWEDCGTETPSNQYPDNTNMQEDEEVEYGSDIFNRISRTWAIASAGLWWTSYSWYTSQISAYSAAAEVSSISTAN